MHHDFLRRHHHHHHHMQLVSSSICFPNMNPESQPEGERPSPHINNVKPVRVPLFTPTTREVMVLVPVCSENIETICQHISIKCDGKFGNGPGNKGLVFAVAQDPSVDLLFGFFFLGGFLKIAFLTFFNPLLLLSSELV